MLSSLRFPRNFASTTSRHISWKGKDDKFKDSLDGLKTTYRKKLLPLEEHTHFHVFHTAKFTDADFEAKPIILLMGQYSTGKTTLIKYMLQQDFPGMRIGPEPTTDRFMSIMHGAREGTIPGNALIVDPTKPFAPLAQFGNSFLSKFQCSTINSPVLERVSLIDTPGILSGEKQRVDRGYDFVGVLEWFAERVDRIILLFDANKLDISDEFKYSIQAIKGNEEKIQIVLNKADSMDTSSLIRVYGSLMWSLGKVLNTPEVSKVFIGSFWDKPLVHAELRKLFESETQALFKDIRELPLNSLLRKLNGISKRARLVKVHAAIVASLKGQMPYMIGKEAKKAELIQNLPEIFETIKLEAKISAGDFPPVGKMQEQLKKFDFSLFKAPDMSLLKAVDDMLVNDITKIMAMLPQDVDEQVKDGAFGQLNENSTPFAYKAGEGFDAGRGETEWIVNRNRSPADEIFERLSAGKPTVPRVEAREEFLKSGLVSSVLGRIYFLADVDEDGLLNRDEFALAHYIIQLKIAGYDVPNELPQHLVPPSMRQN